MFRDLAREKSSDTVMFPQGWQNPPKLTFRVTQHQGRTFNAIFFDKLCGTALDILPNYAVNYAVKNSILCGSYAVKIAYYAAIT